MKLPSCLFLAFLCLNCAWSKAIQYPQLYRVPVLFDGRVLKGVKPVQGNYLYMSEAEVSNAEYCKFLNWLKQNHPVQYAENLPDTNVWTKGNKPFVLYYLRHPAYGRFPLVGITQKQASNYCLWLHDRLAEEFKLKKIQLADFKVRLPNEDEWMNAARGGLSEYAAYPWNSEGIRYTGHPKKHQGKIMMNCRTNLYSLSTMEPYESFITTETYSYWPNGYGLYNMSGNVAEWVSESGLSKGGGWKSPPYNCRIDSRNFFREPDARSAEVGFRFVIEVLKVNAPVQIETFFFSTSVFKKEFMYLPNDSGSKHLKFMSNEICNAWYSQFLKENTNQENLINFKVWNSQFPYQYFEQYAWHPAFKQFPVVGITYEAAQAFCEWLSKKYQNNPKRGYKTVQFRLPDEQEWEWAAHGGHISNYPWNGPFTRNSRGCFLANFSPNLEHYLFQDTLGYLNWYHQGSIESRISDGLLIPGTITSYFPNDYGLYNFSGNVAEMVSEKGLCKGGSWLSDEFGIMIISKERYDAPSASLGFRVLAEVIEK